MVDCYVGMGGNFTDTLTVMRQVIIRLKSEKEISQFQLSRLYRTTPVSSISQPLYLNAVCRFHTQLPLEKLWALLQNLEKVMGKKPKPKNVSRLIDLDLLFYGSLVVETNEWVIPHPRWHERLFVLAPLSDVTEKIPIGEGLCLKKMLERFTNPYQEKIYIYKQNLL